MPDDVRLGPLDGRGAVLHAGDDGVELEARAADGRDAPAEDVLQLAHDVHAGTRAARLDAHLHEAAEVVADMVVSRHVHVRLGQPLEVGLDGHDVRDVVLDRPAGAVGRERELLVGEPASEVGDGLSRVREGVDEAGQVRGWCRVDGHGPTLTTGGADRVPASP